MGDRNTGIGRNQLKDYTLKRQDLSPDGLVWQEPIIDKDLTTPPGSPSEDNRYLIISGSGDWSGHDNDIAHYHGEQWNYYTPIEGWFVWINDEDKLYRFDGSSWAEFAGAGGGDMYKSTYDTGDNGIVDKAENVDDGAGNASSAVDVKDAVTKKHAHSNKTELDLITDGDHDVRSDNPHNVDAEQVDSYTKDETNELIAGSIFDYFLSKTLTGEGSPLDTYYLMYPSDTDETKSNIVKNNVNADDTPIVDFITQIIEPQFKTLSEGVYHIHFHAKVSATSGNLKIRIYTKFYIRDTGGTETLLFTTEESNLLTETEANYSLHGNVSPDIEFATGDRLVLKFYANVEDSGASPDVTFYMEGITETRLGVITNISAFDAKYLQKTEVDDFTIKYENSELKLADRIELNTMLNAFRIAINGSLSQFNMVDGIVDGYEDETGIDTGESTNEDYDSVNDLYKPFTIVDLELDYMEYASDGVAQSAYVSSDVGAYSVDRCTGGSASAYESTGGTNPNNAFNDTPENVWACDPATTPDWVKYDFGSSVSYVLRKVRVYCTFNSPSFNYSGPEDFLIQGSNNDSDWDTLKTIVGLNWTDTPQWKEYTFANSTAYRYVRIYITAWEHTGRNYGVIGEIEALDYLSVLQCYSEDTIKIQGDNSLKGIASQTDSLNETLTKSGLSIDLTDIDEIKFYAYALRTGTNLQMQIHDSGGTTSTKDIVISSSDEWTEIIWDISGISNVNKDDIDEIIIKIINADSENIFYIDNFGVEGITNNMTLISNSFVAESIPTDARLVLFEEDVDSITENTDIIAYVSRDGGSTWAQVTLSDEGDYQSGKRILTGVVDISGIGSGTNIEYKIETLNNKNLKLHGIGLHWD